MLRPLYFRQIHVRVPRQDVAILLESHIFMKKYNRAKHDPDYHVNYPRSEGWPYREQASFGVLGQVNNINKLLNEACTVQVQNQLNAPQWTDQIVGCQI